MDEPTTLALDKGEVSLFQALDGLGCPCLILFSGDEPGRRFDLDLGERVIGRAVGVDVAVDVPGISRRHAALTVTPDQVSLRDLGSANSTYVNHAKVVAPVTLKDGDLIRLANVLFRFHDRRSLDALLHDRLYRLATVDPGTGVFNRRYTLEALKLEWARARRSGQPLALVCCDLDHFKAVNDSYGHSAGDVVLQDSAARLRAELRAGDVIGRWGGEEFLVLLRETGLEQACALAERLRATMADNRFALPPVAPGALPVMHRQTISIGVAVLDAGVADEAELLAMADRRLYAAKRGGRNRVVASDEPEAAPR